MTDWSLDKHKTLEKAFLGDYKSYILDVANTVADVRQVATSRAEFIELMKSKGIETEWKDSHKNITFKTEEGKKVRNSNLTKTFKVDFGKESLENEFQCNEERSRTTQRAREQLNGTDKEPKQEDRPIDIRVIDQTISNRQLQASIIEAERRKRELAKAQQERTKTEKSISVIEKRDNSSKERGFER